MTDRSVEVIEAAVAWVALDPTRGREQNGHRPVVIVSTDDYLAAATTLAIVVPVTSRDRGWDNHVPLSGHTGLTENSWAMTEQPRTISRSRITRVTGTVDADCMARIRIYLRDYLGI